MTKLGLHRISSLLHHRGLAREYLKYRCDTLRHGGEAVRTFPNGTKVGGINGFSEYHAVGEFVSESERAYLSTRSPRGAAIIDVGANLGLVSFLLAKRFPASTVHSFEAHPVTYEALVRNIDLNGFRNVRPVPAALADHDGTMLFSAHPHSRGTASISSTETDCTIDVRSMTLDSYVARAHLANVAFLKVDVEGYEELVFRGAERFLSARKILEIYYEVCPANCALSGLDPSRPTEMLFDYGYGVYRIGQNAQLLPVSVSEVAKTGSDNWIALAP